MSAPGSSSHLAPHLAMWFASRVNVRDFASLLSNIGQLPDSDGFSEILDGALALGTQIGSVRVRNEDRCAGIVAADRQERLLAAVLCDGIGGLPRGDEAAAVAVASFAAHILSSSQADLVAPSPLERRAVDGVLAANAAVFTAFGGNSGCTLSAVMVSGREQFVFCHVGDSAIFSVTDSTVTRLTRRHTVQGELQRLGQQLDAPGSKARGRDELLEYIGMSEAPEVDSQTVQLNSRGTRLVIMSDGAVRAENALHPLLEHAPTCRDIVRRTLAYSKWTGGQDNASVIALDLPAAIDRLPPTVAPLVQTASLRIPFIPTNEAPPGHYGDPGAGTGTNVPDERPERRKRPRSKRRKSTAAHRDQRDAPELEIQFIDDPHSEGDK